MNQRAAGRFSSDTGSAAHSDLIASQLDKASQREVASRARWLSIAVCISLALAVWAVFGQTLKHDFVNLDDTFYVSDNPHVLSGLTWWGFGWAFRNLEAGFWQPLTWLSLMADYQFYGLRAGGYHLSSVLLHMANTLLLFALLRRVTGALWRSAMVAALFGLHPLHVESVAWISERKDVLSTLFLMLTLLCYARHAKERGVAISRPFSFFRSPFYWLALLFFAFGLMSKTMLVTLPVVMWLLDFWPLGRVGAGDAPPSMAQVLWEKVPFIALAFVSGVVTMRAEKAIGALAEEGDLAFPLRVQNAAVSSLYYLGQTLWPTKMAVFYPYPISYSIARVVASLLVLALISVAAFWWRHRCPYLVVGWFWYLITLAPVSGLIQVGSHSRADRYTYVPLVGIFLAGVWGVMELCGSLPRRRLLLGSAAAAIVVVLMATAFVQTAYWKNSISLWTHALACTYESPLAHNNLGNAFVGQGKLDEAVQHFERALQLKPDYAKAHNNLGNALFVQGKLDEAVQHFERALEFNPDYVKTHNNLGRALAIQGKLDEAIRHFERGLQLSPGSAEIHSALADVLAKQGRMQEAIQHYERAIELKPNFAVGHNNLAIVFAQTGKSAAAIDHLQRAIQIDHNYAEAHNNLGNTLTLQGKLDEAIPCYERALRIKPDYAEAHYNLGKALASKGRLMEAVQNYEQALQIRPDYIQAHYNLRLALTALRRQQQAIEQSRRAPQPKPPDAMANNALGIELARQGKLIEATRLFEMALQLNPDYVEAHGNLARALADKGKWVEAIEHFQRALQLNPADMLAHNGLGIALARQGKMDEAIRHFDRALQIEPRFAEAHDNLGHVLADQGKFKEARVHFQQALDLATAQHNAALVEGVGSRLRACQAAMLQPSRP